MKIWSIGGDNDTLAAITGSIAVQYSVSDEIVDKALLILGDRLRIVYKRFSKRSSELRVHEELDTPS